MFRALLLLFAMLGLALAQDCVVFEICESSDCSSDCGDKMTWEAGSCIQHDNDTDLYFTFDMCGESTTDFMFFNDSACTNPVTNVSVSFPSCDVGHNFVKCDSCQEIEDSRTLAIVVGVIGGILVLILIVLCIAVCVRDNRYRVVER